MNTLKTMLRHALLAIVSTAPPWPRIPPLSTRALLITLGILFAVALFVSAAAAVLLVLRRLRELSGEHRILAKNQAALLSALRAAPRDSAPHRAATTDTLSGQHRLVCEVAHELLKMKRRVSELPADLAAASSLGHALDRLHRELESRGYTVRDLTGQPYVEGMQVSVVEFAPQSDPSATDRIERTLKPEVRYHDRIIRPAEVVVSARATPGSATHHLATQSPFPQGVPL
jgi:hypothetical protein